MDWEIHIINDPGVNEMRMLLDDFPGIPSVGTLLNVFYDRTWCVSKVLIDTMLNRVVVWADDVDPTETPDEF